jgi:hypothetical protein
MLQASFDRLQASTIAAAGALGSDEAEHIGGADVLRWLVHDAEEHPQVVRGCEHRVRSTPTREELQIIVDQRPQPHHRLTGRSWRADQARVGQGHLAASSSVDRQPQRLVEMSWKITCITSMSALLAA